MVLVVGEHPFDLTHRLAFQTFKQLAGRLGIVNTSRRDQDCQQQTHAVHDNMSFSAIDVLGVVPSAMFAAAGRFDRLAVNTGGSPWRVGFLRRTDLAAKLIMDNVECAVVTPLIEVPPDRTPGREVLGQVPPLATGAKDIEDGINDISNIGFARSSAWVHGYMRFNK